MESLLPFALVVIKPLFRAKVWPATRKVYTWLWAGYLSLATMITWKVSLCMLQKQYFIVDSWSWPGKGCLTWDVKVGGLGLACCLLALLILVSSAAGRHWLWQPRSSRDLTGRR